MVVVDVVFALADLGVVLILLVLVPMIKKPPSLARVALVPSPRVIIPPGVSVVPNPRSYTVLPLDRVAGYMWPSIVKAGAAVMLESD